MLLNNRVELMYLGIIVILSLLVVKSHLCIYNFILLYSLYP